MPPNNLLIYMNAFPEGHGIAAAARFDPVFASKAAEAVDAVGTLKEVLKRKEFYEFYWLRRGGPAGQPQEGLAGLQGKRRRGSV